MQTATSIRSRQHRDGENGYMLLAVMFLLFLLALSLMVAAPRMAREIQLDRERETMKRGLQYRRAIQLYYRKFHSYPPTLEALVKTNDIRFLRKRYLDPITGKDDWKLIHLGQNKTQTLGFFGQPLAGASSSLAGSATSSSSSSLFGSSSSSSSTDTSSGASATGTAATSATSTSSSASSSSGFLSSSTTSQTFGGLGVIGVSPNSSRQSIMIYKKKNHYNEWEFFYDPLSDQKMVSSSLGSLSSSSSSSTSSSTGSSSSSSSTSSSGSTSSSSTF